jgi:hypothetical protein
MKGVELPINVIVIVVLCLVVLLAILALFWGVWTPGVAGISLEAAKNNACQMLVSTGCDSPASITIKDFDADKDGTLNEADLISSTDPADCKPGNNGKTLGDNLVMLCLCWYGADETSCKTRICNCP